MSRTRWFTFAVVALFAAALIVPSAGAQGGGDALEATDIGVTEDTITVTVVAAIEVPGFPGLFQGSHDGVDGWAKYINNSCKPKNTCVAGREIVVKHVDSKLGAEPAQAGFRQACQDSFAIIGTGVLLNEDFDDISECVDAAGAATGLPDFAIVLTEPNEICTGVSFGVNPAALDCATRDEHPQSYTVSAGPAEYYAKKFKDLKSAMLFPSDSASAKNSQLPIFEAINDLGLENVYQEDVSALAQQSAYTAIVAAMRDAGVTYARSGLAFDSTVKMRSEAASQGIDMTVWDCSLQCYDEQLVAPENVDIVEGQYVYTPFLPFLGATSEAKNNKMLRNFLKNTDKTDGFAIQAFAAGLFFQEAVEAATGGDNNNLTREGVLAAAADIHEFDADGMLVPTEVGGRIASGCYVLMQVRNGEFVRVHPKKKGTFDCKTEPQTVELDIIN
ncbi:MAG: ABC transporter substrate-binding protein [Acidimicrobiia bacterium]